MGRPPLGDIAMSNAERQRRHRAKKNPGNQARTEEEEIMKPNFKVLQEPDPLPNSANQWLAVRKLKKDRTLNDQVEDIHLSLVEDDKYTDFLKAIYDAQAVEGSQTADDIFAAQMIRAKAIKMGYHEVAHEKAWVIVRCLHVILKRYGLTRYQRRNTVAGQIVPEEPTSRSEEEENNENE